MPADDLVLNVRQIAGYPPTANAPTNALLLMQLGIGGPYQSISPQDLVGTALSTGGSMVIGGPLSVQAIAGGSAQFSNGVFNVFSAQKACIVDLAATWGSIAGVPIATVDDVSNLNAAIRAASVWSFNGRVGDVRLWIDDIICAGGAPIFSPRFQGSPRACTPDPTSNSSRLATTAFVATALGVAFAAYAPLDSPAFTGLPTAPTAPQGSADGQLATTAFVANAVADSTTGVASFNGRTGIVALVGGDITAAGGALLASPVFTGTPSAPTQPTTDNSTRLATTAFVQAFAAPLASPAFTGIPTGPTAAPSTSTTQLATTAFVTAAITEGMAGTVTTFNGRSGAVNLIANDVSAAGGAMLVSPAFTGTPTAPTAAPSTSNAQLATCAFVMAAVATGGGVLTFNGRAGTVSLTAADVSGVGGALLAAPAFTGVPTAPTAAPATNTIQLATCAFVQAAVAAATAGVASFNGRTGAVSLIATDVTAVLPASTTTPAMNGTASPGTQAAWARGDHVHPVDTSRYAATNPSNFQTAAQVSATLAAYLPLAGGSLSGALGVGGTLNVANCFAAGPSTLTVTPPITANGGIVSQVNLNLTAAANLILNQSPGATTSQQINWTNLSPATAGQIVYFYNAAQMAITNSLSGGSISLVSDGSLNYNNGNANKPGGGPWVDSASDVRVKTVHRDYEQGLDAILGLRPVVYSFKGNDVKTKGQPSLHKNVAEAGTRFVGLVAQAVEPVMPEMVIKTKAFIDERQVDDLLQLDTGPLIFALVNAVKTLAARLTAVEQAA
jgi:hypothetical protein